MFAAMRLANEHHSAIFATKFPESIQSEIVGTDAPHDFAKKIWQSHARHELPFIRARAAYALAELGENIEYQARRALNKRVQEYKTALAAYKEQGQSSRDEAERLNKQREELLGQSQQLDAQSAINRTHALAALEAISVLGENEYPSLRFNVYCMILRKGLNAPSDGTNQVEMDLQAIDKGLSLSTLANLAIRIGLEQRKKLSAADVFGKDREQLFNRYRDAFELGVEVYRRMGTEGYARAVITAAQSSNQSIIDYYPVAQLTEEASYLLDL